MKKLLLIAMFAALLAAGCGRDVIIITPSSPSGQTPDNSGNDNNNDNPSDNPNDDGDNAPDTPSNGYQDVDPNCIIYYTTSTGEIIRPSMNFLFSGENDKPSSVFSNTYENGVGMIICSNPVTMIHHDTFSGPLTSITLPESLKTIESRGFAECYELEAFYGKFASADNKCLVPDGNLVSFAKGCGLTEYNIPAGITTISIYAFSKCGSIANVNIGNDVITVGGAAFYECENLKNVNISGSVMSIDEYAFYNCGNLTSINFSNGLMSIGEYAFGNCDNLKSITIPDSVNEIGESAFRNCENLQSAYIGAANIGEYAFQDCGNLTNINFSNGLTSIGKNAFRDCGNLKSITIPDSVNEIEEGAFYDCKNLQSAYIGAANIGDFAFGAFLGNNLRTITFGKNVSYISPHAFSVNYDSKIDIYCRPTTPPTLGDDSFLTWYDNIITVYVPRAAVDAYKTSVGWSCCDIQPYDFE